MRISHVQIENFRSHRYTEIDFDDYTALIGANGAGKSSVFYALSWFFDGGAVPEGDVNTAEAAQSAIVQVSVSVTFVDLTAADRERLGEYGRGDVAHFSRSWSTGADKSKVVGNALAGPGFPEVRRESRVTFKRPLYMTLIKNGLVLADLGSSPSADAIDQSLADWESGPANSASMAKVDHGDANHLFGINGRNVIRECIRLIMVPAATDISANVGATGKGSTLADLIGAVTSAASARARENWVAKYSQEIAELNTAIRIGVDAATASHASRINARLAAMIPDASIDFSTQVPDWTPRGEPSVSTQVSVGSATGDLGNQGHGTQRAVMIAMFQSMAPDEASTAADNPKLDGETQEDYEVRLDDAVGRLPTLIVCIEEPEIYQHPVRARAFARVLSDLSTQPGVQIAVATHSPYFVRPTQFENLRRLSLTNGNSSVTSTTLTDAASAAGVDVEKFSMTVERHLPSVFSEGFFADSVILVEGDTDKVCLEGLSECLSFSFDLAGIAVIHVGGKNELRMAYVILNALGVPTYVIADGDADRADQKHAAGTSRHAAALASNAQQTAALVAWLPETDGLDGAASYAFGDPTFVSGRFTVWRDDLETELDQWPSFLGELAHADGALRDKKASTYRAAAMAALESDVPVNLRSVVSAVRAFSGH
ncbi:ATP-dependent endonuclease [Cryobacterium sp. TMT1-21]|uniref:ATP-dependent nuclease n=1 Tax=Cryobacterium sp. TMT1-21 TaxID=1259234 RepID=UPI00106BCBC3|nr:AAA family ATPase [Cryobacterium sp. TMT1-21]TFD13792.1 ATP-dependent endonuclease [Cryobacterium sp. TMT1-21]